MKQLLKPSSHSNLYHATMRSPSFGLPSRNQITRVDLRERKMLKKIGQFLPAAGQRVLMVRINPIKKKHLQCAPCSVRILSDWGEEEEM